MDHSSLSRLKINGDNYEYVKVKTCQGKENEHFKWSYKNICKDVENIQFYSPESLYLMRERERVKFNQLLLYFIIDKQDKIKNCFIFWKWEILPESKIISLNLKIS